MKYKVKIDCPGFGRCEIYETDDLGYIFSNHTKIKVLPKLFPYIFEQSKEPLFKAFYGVEIYNGDRYWFVDEDFDIVDYIADMTPDWYRKKYTDFCFSSYESAEKWVKKNKPIFSEKQVLDAIRLSKESDLELCRRFIEVIDFREKLGID